MTPTIIVGTGLWEIPYLMGITLASPGSVWLMSRPLQLFSWKLNIVIQGKLSDALHLWTSVGVILTLWAAISPCTTDPIQVLLSNAWPYNMLNEPLYEYRSPWYYPWRKSQKRVGHLVISKVSLYVSQQFIFFIYAFVFAETRFYHYVSISFVIKFVL